MTPKSGAFSRRLRWTSALTRLDAPVLLRPAGHLRNRRAVHVHGAGRAIEIPEIQGKVDVSKFREVAYAPGLPLVMRRNSSEVAVDLPALSHWFIQPGSAGEGPGIAPKLKDWAHTSVDYEIMCPRPTSLDLSSLNDEPLKRFLAWLADHPVYNVLHGILSEHIKHSHGHSPFSPQESETQLLRFNGPLAIFLAALEHRDAILATTNAVAPFRNLYIAQSSLDSLPAALQEDVPTPQLVSEAGKGDVYGTSVWLGLEPTYTPLHRDPNPNIFCQLCATKVIRVIPPEQGARMFRAAQQKAGATVFSPMLSVEMMTGGQRAALHEAVWGPGASQDVGEAVLGPGDAMFIPKGWWHSVRSLGNRAGVNGSVNWWFR